jgi:formate dehydrogenase major subunit
VTKEKEESIKARKVFGSESAKASGEGLGGVFIRGALNDDAIVSKSHKEKKLHKSIREIPTVCPYCGVGCGFLATLENGRIINMEGDPDNPFNKGTACSKGMAIRQLSVENPLRLGRVLYRPPGGSEWQEKTWNWTIDQIAHRIRDTRDANFKEKDGSGRVVNRNYGIAHIGCAPLNTEESYLISKMQRALGVVYIDHVVRL